MLEVTYAAQEDLLGVNFTDIYKNSELCRSDHHRFPFFSKKTRSRGGKKNKREVY